MFRKSIVFAILFALLVTGGSAVAGKRKMLIKKLDTNVCQTRHGGRFVNIKQFPGEKIDRRLRRDIRFLIRKYNIFITDGYSRDPVHSINGEHPLGLALDIVPNFANGGSWDDIDALARWAEPRQNQPRAPFRWVGYRGDAGHGRGHHLHLSYDHNRRTKPFRPARKVLSVKCPRPGVKPPAPAPDPPPSEPPAEDPGPSGGVSTALAPAPSGGVSASYSARSAETAGADYGAR